MSDPFAPSPEPKYGEPGYRYPAGPEYVAHPSDSEYVADPDKPAKDAAKAENDFAAAKKQETPGKLDMPTQPVRPDNPASVQANPAAAVINFPHAESPHAHCKVGDRVRVLRAAASGWEVGTITTLDKHCYGSALLDKTGQTVGLNDGIAWEPIPDPAKVEKDRLKAEKDARSGADKDAKARADRAAKDDADRARASSK